MREFDSNNDGSIDFNEYKLMVQALQNGKFDDYNSDEEIETIKKKCGEAEFEKLMERNR
tara:strand:- start:595 stop:771 length:177 start_codon:yes stop_codon:yes gene_type:complete